MEKIEKLEIPDTNAIIGLADRDGKEIEIKAIGRKINEIIDVLNSWIFQPTLVIPSQEKKHSRELVCMKCGSKENLNTNKDKSFVECDDCMWGIEKDGTRLADEFYSLAPRYRTKVKLQEMIDKWLDKAREEGKLEYILSLGWQDTNNEYVKEVLEDADRIANELSKLKDNK